MNDFLRTEIYSKDEAYLILMRPGTPETGASEVTRMKVPLETLKDMVLFEDENRMNGWVTEHIRDQVIFAENGIFSFRD